MVCASRTRRRAETPSYTGPCATCAKEGWPCCEGKEFEGLQPVWVDQDLPNLSQLWTHPPDHPPNHPFQNATQGRVEGEPASQGLPSQSLTHPPSHLPSSQSQEPTNNYAESGQAEGSHSTGRKRKGVFVLLEPAPSEPAPLEEENPGDLTHPTLSSDSVRQKDIDDYDLAQDWVNYEHKEAVFAEMCRLSDLFLGEEKDSGGWTYAFPPKGSVREEEENLNDSQDPSVHGTEPDNLDLYEL